MRSVFPSQAGNYTPSALRLKMIGMLMSAGSSLCKVHTLPVAMVTNFVWHDRECSLSRICVLGQMGRGKAHSTGGNYLILCD